MESTVGFGGRVGAKKITAPKAPLSWRLKNTLRGAYIGGLLANRAAHVLSMVTGIPTLRSQLSARLLRADGSAVNYGVVGYKLVTTAFVEYMVDEMIAETTAWGDFKFHDSGVGTTAAAIGDTDIETTDGQSRSTGTQLEGATGEIYKSVGTITYGGTLAITEHGLMNIATAGILLDRHVFSAINVESTDSIEFTYELTVDDGG